MQRERSQVILPPSIPAAVGSLEALRTLDAAIGASSSTVQSALQSGPITVFAPINAAFEAIDEAALSALLADQPALDRVLSAPLTAQLIVSSQDLDALIASTRAPDPSEEGDEEESTGSKVTRPNLATAFVAPETDLHKTVTKVWEELLGIEGIGIHDDFFDLGGHSLLLTQLVSRVRKQVKTEISLRSLFEKRTVAGIAEEIEKAQGEGDKPKGPQLKRVSRAAYKRKKSD